MALNVAGAGGDAPQVEAALARTKQEIESVWPNFGDSGQSKEAAAARPKLQPVVSQVGVLESRIEEKEIAIEEAKSRVEIERLKAEVEKLRIEKEKAEAELNSRETRYLEVHEHRPLFERSLTEAKNRLLIISPWIRDAVLNSYRTGKLKNLVEKGVEVFIGYGLGEDDKPCRDKGDNAVVFLEQLAQRKPILHFHELGDTHAKILLVDDRFAVIGSFNWLSFEGSSRKDFREEMSFRTNKKEEIERLFQRYVKRFPRREKK